MFVLPSKGFDLSPLILQHQSLSALDHSTTSAPLKWSFNNRSATLSLFESLKIDIRHVSKRA
jgi:hypothetical protein